MELIDQVLWEQELAEHLNRDTEEPAELEEFARLNGIEELDGIDADPREEPPDESADLPAAVVILLWSLAILTLGSCGWLLGHFLV